MAKITSRIGVKPKIEKIQTPKKLTIKKEKKMNIAEKKDSVQITATTGGPVSVHSGDGNASPEEILEAAHIKVESAASPFFTLTLDADHPVRVAEREAILKDAMKKEGDK